MMWSMWLWNWNQMKTLRIKSDDVGVADVVRVGESVIAVTVATGALLA